MNSITRTISFILILTTLLACEPPKKEDVELVNDFYNLNKGESYNELSNLFIESRNTIYDPKTEKYQVMVYVVGVYDTISKNYLKIPLFKKGADKNEILKVFHDCDENCKTFLSEKYNLKDSSELIDVYVEFVNKVLDRYNNIKLPKQCRYTNVLRIQGMPKQHRLSFKLTDEAEVFFFSKRDSTNALQFKKLTKLDESWYYRIKSSQTTE